MSTAAVTHDDLLELSRRALIADFACHARGAAGVPPPRGARQRQAMPARSPGRSINAAGASRTARRRPRARASRGATGKAASARQSSPSSCARPPPRWHCVPPEWTADPHDWALVALMNVGSLAHTPAGQAAGVARRPSLAALDERERGCQAIARRGAGRCIVCGTAVHPTPVSGAVRARSIQPRDVLSRPAPERSATTSTPWPASSSAARGWPTRRWSSTSTSCRTRRGRQARSGPGSGRIVECVTDALRSAGFIGTVCRPIRRPLLCKQQRSRRPGHSCRSC